MAAPRFVVAFGVAWGVLGGCAELGVVSDGTSISVGKASHGYLIEGARLPDHGVGFTTRKVWLDRDNRYGTDELVDLVTAVARRMSTRIKDVKIVIADLSSRGGGGAFAFHRSHQSGRDADFLPYMRDADGKPFEPDAMHVFDRTGRAVDGSGITLDVPRTWLLVTELLAAPEAPVQYIFMYEPLCQLLIEHARQRGEPEALIAKARMALRQPGDSARHDDHMHVRVYCAANDRAYGCIDMGPMELLAQREAERQGLPAMAVAPAPEPSAGQAAVKPDTGTWRDQLAEAGVVEPADADAMAPSARSAPVGAVASAPALLGIIGPRQLRALGARLRARTDRTLLRSWR